MPVIANAMGGTNAISGAIAGCIIWQGFVGPAGLANRLFAGYLKAWAIESGNHLINFVAFGAIIGALILVACIGFPVPLRARHHFGET